MRQSRRKFIRNVALGSLLGSLSFKNALGKPSTWSKPTSFDKTDKDLWQEVRKAFLLSENRNYFNTAGLGVSPKIVIDTVHKNMLKVEEKGESFHSDFKKAHEVIAQFFATKSENIAITRNTTEGMNIIARSLSLKKGDEVILTTHEHVGGAVPWLALQDAFGVSVKLVDLDLSGEKNYDLIKKSITRKTRAVVVSHITCTTGMVLPVKEIAALCKANQIYSCIDGAQAAGMININFKDIKPDFYATSGHKWLFGPKETGLLFMDKQIVETTSPTFVGAYSVKEYNLKDKHISYIKDTSREEYGTRSMPIARGLESAINFLDDIGIDKVESRGKNMAEYLKTELGKIKGVEVLSPTNPQFASAIVTFRIEGTDYTKVANRLAHKYKCRVRAIYENDLNGIRISCAIYNNFEELDQLIEGVRQLA